jgi:hypothetical protein
LLRVSGTTLILAPNLRSRDNDAAWNVRSVARRGFRGRRKSVRGIVAEMAGTEAQTPRLDALPPKPAIEMPSDPTAAGRTIPGIDFNLNLIMRIIPPSE